MTAEESTLVDVGPATPPPSWCLPDAVPTWQRLTERFGGIVVCSWERKVSDDVWIECDDRVVGGRVMRAAPRIHYFDPGTEGIGCVQARALADALIAAADVIACAALDEAVK